MKKKNLLLRASAAALSLALLLAGCGGSPDADPDGSAADRKSVV